MQWKYISISMDIPIQMKDREISIKNEKIILRDEVETLYEKTVTPFGNSGKVDVTFNCLTRYFTPILGHK